MVEADRNSMLYRYALYRLSGYSGREGVRWCRDDPDWSSHSGIYIFQAAGGKIEYRMGSFLTDWLIVVDMSFAFGNIEVFGNIDNCSVKNGIKIL